MIVVSDTGPLNYLVRLHLSDVLRDLYGRVIMPAAVLTELRRESAPPQVRAWASAPPLWVEERTVAHLDPTLTVGLGPGERHAISLALELRAAYLLIDDLSGRRQALERNLVVTGTLGVLMEASLLGRCRFEDEVKRLRDFGAFIAPELEVVMLARYRDKLRNLASRRRS